MADFRPTVIQSRKGFNISKLKGDPLENAHPIQQNHQFTQLFGTS